MKKKILEGVGMLFVAIGSCEQLVMFALIGFYLLYRAAKGEDYEALIQDFIKQMKQEHPNLELSMNDIYDSALRTGIDAVLEQIRTDRRQKIMEDWIHATKSYTRKNDSGI